MQMPAVFFVFDLAPIHMTIRDSRNFLHFLVRICAVVGGVFAVTGESCSKASLCLPCCSLSWIRSHAMAHVPQECWTAGFTGSCAHLHNLAARHESWRSFRCTAQRLTSYRASPALTAHRMAPSLSTSTMLKIFCSELSRTFFAKNNAASTVPSA